MHMYSIILEMLRHEMNKFFFYFVIFLPFLILIWSPESRVQGPESSPGFILCPNGIV